MLNEHDAAKSDIIEEIIQVETDEIVLKKCTSQFVTSEEMKQMVETKQKNL